MATPVSLRSMHRIFLQLIANIFIVYPKMIEYQDSQTIQYFTADQRE